MSTGPLAGVRVVEMAGLGPVPFACMLLADMGAEILTVAAPGRAIPGDDPVWRGRSPLPLDLKRPGASAALLAVLARADVLVEGFRPGVMERNGLGPEPCLSANPRLVYGRMTGWGREGPLAARAGHDPNYIGLVGALHAIGEADRPPTPPLNLVGDLGGGALYLAMGVLAALLKARQSGQGEVVEAAMIDGAASLMTGFYALHAAGRWSNARHDNLMDGGAPFGGAYETADGKYMVVAAVEDRFYDEFVGGLGLAAADLPPRADRAAWPELRRRFAAAFRSRSRDEWSAIFTSGDACVTPVLDLDEAPAHPHNRARGVFIERDGRPLPAPAPRFRGSPTSPAPSRGRPPSELLEAWGVAGGASSLLLGG